MHATNRHKKITILSKPENISKAVAELVDFVGGVRKGEQHALTLSVTEAVSNAIVHGNESNPNKKVQLKALAKPEQVTIQVTDEGRGFDPQRVQDPTKKENLLKLSGRGIFFIRRFMDEVRFNTLGNEITMIKYLN
ncbi:ATP-binding protein [bacterium]|nr:ATP-binding protein [bacterium]